VQPPSTGGAATGFTFRPLAKPEEFRAAEELQALGPSGIPESPATVPVLRAAQDHGGLVLGAFADIYLAGAAVGWLGWDGSTLYHYLHRLVVRPEYQNHGVATSLALRVREQLQAVGLDTVRGHSDPLSSRAAYLAFHRLGATSDRYLSNLYGQQGPEGSPDRESDRLLWRWSLGDAAVTERLAIPRLPRPPPDPQVLNSPSIVETEVGESGLRLPTAVVEPAGAPFVRLEIPFDLELLHQHEPAGARRWRHAARDAFRGSFDLGYRVEGFDVLPMDHERRSFYLLAYRPAVPASAPSAPP
jgi:predicted GNAT superfamily acetyltransferase